MPILIFAIVVVIVAFLGCYLVDVAQVTPPLNPILKAAIILIAILLIISKMGMV